MHNTMGKNDTAESWGHCKQIIEHGDLFYFEKRLIRSCILFTWIVIVFLKATVIITSAQKYTQKVKLCKKSYQKRLEQNKSISTITITKYTSSSWCQNC